MITDTEKLEIIKKNPGGDFRIKFLPAIPGRSISLPDFPYEPINQFTAI